MIKEKNSNQKKLTIGLFTVYFLLLTWIILFKMQFSLNNLVGLRSFNLIPFHGSMIVNGKIDMKEIIYNVIVFIPFGIYICMINDKLSLLKRILTIASISLIYEVLQFILAIGAFDITDFIGNTFGGIIGITIYFLISKLFKSSQKMNKVLNIIALIITILIVVFLSFMIIVNL